MSEKPADPSHDDLAWALKEGWIRSYNLYPLLRSLLARIEALEARNYQYSRELDTVLLRIRDDYHSADH